MQKPQKPKEPFRFVFPPQKKSYYPKSYWKGYSRGYYTEDPFDLIDNWDTEEDPENFWKQTSLGAEVHITLADVVKIANKNNLPLEDVYIGLFTEEYGIAVSLFSIESQNNPRYQDMVEEAEYQEKQYQRDLELYKEQMKEYPLKLKKYKEFLSREIEDLEE